MIDEIIQKYQKNYDVLDIVYLDQWYDQESSLREYWLRKKLQSLHKVEYRDRDRLLFVLTKGDEYADSDSHSGVIMMTLQKLLTEIDISNFFCVIITDNISGSPQSRQWLAKNISIDPVPLNFEIHDISVFRRLISNKQSAYTYDSVQPVKISLESLSDRHRYLLAESDTFCIYPWIHLHTYPTGDAKPCCHAEMKAGSVGNTKVQSMTEIWNGEKMKDLRLSMLQGQPHEQCTRCYEQEKSGFFSGRRSANKHHGHHIHLVDETGPDGHLDRFNMIYWDIRFSNLCNLRCRSCGHIFSSQWYQDQAKLAGPEWKKNNKVLKFSGRTETDMWEQLEPHLDYVEQIYFAGGEPLIMDEHYLILEELERRKKFDVRLIYNTNFTETRLKDRLVFDYWKKFESVAVGASLDGMGPHAEYIRKGTDWQQVEENRYKMLEICPEVDFYCSFTLSILNAWHVSDFHRDWVDKGLIKPKDFNINILQDPAHYRIDIAPTEYKKIIQAKWEDHIEWLRPLDKLKRATTGFESAIKFLTATDNTELIQKFWEKNDHLDNIRNERLLDSIPELVALK